MRRSLLATPCTHPTGYGTPIHRGRVSALWLLLLRSLTPVIGLCAVICLASTYLEAAAVWLSHNTRKDVNCVFALLVVKERLGFVRYESPLSVNFLLDCVQYNTFIPSCQVVTG